VRLKEAIEVYGKHLDEKGLKPGPNAERLRRLRAFFPDETVLLSDLTTAMCGGYYEALRTVVSARTGKAYSVDTHRNTLAEARSLAKWCVAKHWLRSNPVEAVEGKGKRRHGKPQLRIDEARRWMAKAAELADAGEAGGCRDRNRPSVFVQAGQIAEVRPPHLSGQTFGRRTLPTTPIFSY
jgi:hypothetical protein